MAAIFFMRSLNANSEGGGGGAVKETSGLVSAAIPGKGNIFRESVCCKMTLLLSLCRATFEGRSKADVSGEDLKSELALRFFGAVAPAADAAEAPSPAPRLRRTSSPS